MDVTESKHRHLSLICYLVAVICLVSLYLFNANEKRLGHYSAFHDIMVIEESQERNRFLPGEVGFTMFEIYVFSMGEDQEIVFEILPI